MFDNALGFFLFLLLLTLLEIIFYGVDRGLLLFDLETEFYNRDRDFRFRNFVLEDLIFRVFLCLGDFVEENLLYFLDVERLFLILC